MINIMIKQPPKVVNIQFNEYDVFIGRPSKWGNPFKIGEGKYTREQALEKFDEWIVGQADLLDDIEELRGKYSAAIVSLKGVMAIRYYRLQILSFR